MKYKKLEIPELILYEPLIHSEDRGFLYVVSVLSEDALVMIKI